MYVRNTSFPNGDQKDNSVPENYSGYAMSTRNQSEGSQKAEEIPKGQANEYESSLPKEEAAFSMNRENECEYASHKENRLLSGIFEKLGIKGAESSDITVLIIALLLLNGENDDYIWILLLLLLIMN